MKETDKTETTRNVFYLKGRQKNNERSHVKLAEFASKISTNNMFKVMNKEHKITKKRKCSKYCDWPECTFDECIMEEGKIEEHGCSEKCQETESFKGTEHEGVNVCEDGCVRVTKDQLIKKNQSRKGGLHLGPIEDFLCQAMTKVGHSKTQMTSKALHDLCVFIKGFSESYASQAVARREKEIRQEVIDELINTPQSANFIDSVKTEMAHHLERWGDESYREPHSFQMVVSYINGKLLKAIWDKDKKKYEHHLTTIAAVCGTAHKYLKSKSESKKWFDTKDHE